MTNLSVSANFDGGNIECLSCDDPQNIRLNIRKDNQSDFYQWFYFRLSGGVDQPCRLIIENAGGSAYTPGWENYRAVASYDRETWFRVETDYREGQLTIHHTPYHNTIWFAYFAPYSMERHADLLASIQLSHEAQITSLGTTLDGQDIDMVTIGESARDKKVIWVTARQHPGETMAEWWMEGFLERLLNPEDPVATRLKQKAFFYIIPNMNPDGSRRGHLRTNAIGVNLNREWNKASLDKSPEVFCVLNKMRQTGIDLALDVHGDENLPYNFIAGGEGAPGFSQAQQAWLDRYKQALYLASPDFQTTYGYPVNAPGTADMSICTNYLAGEFPCLAMTLEMPFKDNNDLPNEEFGWSPERARLLGAANLDAMLDFVTTAETH
ncbi:MAG: M14 family metallopeptidase [bacterium]